MLSGIDLERCWLEIMRNSKIIVPSLYSFKSFALKCCVRKWKTLFRNAEWMLFHVLIFSFIQYYLLPVSTCRYIVTLNIQTKCKFNLNYLFDLRNVVFQENWPGIKLDVTRDSKNQRIKNLHMIGNLQPRFPNQSITHQGSILEPHFSTDSTTKTPLFSIKLLVVLCR